MLLVNIILELVYTMNVNCVYTKHKTIQHCYHSHINTLKLKLKKKTNNNPISFYGNKIMNNSVFF